MALRDGEWEPLGMDVRELVWRKRTILLLLYADQRVPGLVFFGKKMVPVTAPAEVRLAATMWLEQHASTYILAPLHASNITASQAHGRLNAGRAVSSIPL